MSDLPPPPRPTPTPPPPPRVWCASLVSGDQIDVITDIVEFQFVAPSTWFLKRNDRTVVAVTVSNYLTVEVAPQ